MHARVLLACLSTTVLTLAAAAFVPMRRFTRPALANDLIGSSGTPPRSSQRLREALLMTHVTSTIVVLVAAGLFVRAVIHGFGAGPGFDVDRTAFVVAEVVPAFAAADENFEKRLALAHARTERLREGLLSLPGIEQVALGWSPIDPERASSMLAPKQVETRGASRELKVGVFSAGPELLSALGIPILKGRSLTAADATSRPTPGIVTASLARTLWPNEEPLGQIVSLGGRFGRYTVVGIAQDFVYGSVNEPSAAVVVSVRSGYLGIEPRFVIRTARPELQVDAIRKMVNAVVPNAPRVVVTTGREIMARDLGRQRLGAWFFSAFGLVALLLGTGGVFGLVAYMAESRRREFGVRLALGATRRDIVWRGVATGLRPVAVGVGIGLLSAGFVSRIFVSLLPGLSALDPMTYASVSTLIVASATASGLAAAWRLRRLPPGDALRAE